MEEVTGADPMATEVAAAVVTEAVEGEDTEAASGVDHRPGMEAVMFPT